MQKLFVAIDGGGTHCRLRLLDENQNILAEAGSGSANITSNFDLALANITNAYKKALAKASIDLGATHQVYGLFGLAGGGNQLAAQKLMDALNFTHLWVKTDIDLSLKACLDQKDGIIASFGTGSFYLKQLNGELTKIGGYGMQIGDEASGADIGRNLLRHVLYTKDGIIAPSKLTEKVFAQFDHEVIKVINFAKNATALDFAQYGKLIADHYKDNDPVAMLIIDRAIKQVKDNLSFLEIDQMDRLYFTGSLGQFYAKLLSKEFQGKIKQPQMSHLDAAQIMLFEYVNNAD